MYGTPYVRYVMLFHKNTYNSLISTSITATNKAKEFYHLSLKVKFKLL